MTEADSVHVECQRRICGCGHGSRARRESSRPWGPLEQWGYTVPILLSDMGRVLHARTHALREQAHGTLRRLRISVHWQI